MPSLLPVQSQALPQEASVRCATVSLKSLIRYSPMGIISMALGGGRSLTIGNIVLDVPLPKCQQVGTHLYIVPLSMTITAKCAAHLQTVQALRIIPTMRILLISIDKEVNYEDTAFQKQ